MKKWLTILIVTMVVNSLAYGYLKTDYNWVDYGGHQYALTLEYSDWAQAEAWAQEVGGHLANINDQAENDFLTQFITGHPTQANDPIAWIGLEFIGGDSDSRYNPEFWRWVCGDPISVWYPYSGALPTYSGMHGYLEDTTGYDPGTWGWNPDHETILMQQPYGVIEIVPEPATLLLLTLGGLALRLRSGRALIKRRAE